MRAHSLCLEKKMVTKNNVYPWKPHFPVNGIFQGYSEIPLLRPPKIKTSYLLKTLFAKFKQLFSAFLHPVYLWLEITFGTVQKWSLRPLLDSPKGGLKIGILLYITLVESFVIWCHTLHHDLDWARIHVDMYILIRLRSAWTDWQEADQSLYCHPGVAHHPWRFPECPKDYD